MWFSPAGQTRLLCGIYCDSLFLNSLCFMELSPSCCSPLLHVVEDKPYRDEAQIKGLLLPYKLNCPRACGFPLSALAKGVEDLISRGCATFRNAHLRSNTMPAVNSHVDPCVQMRSRAANSPPHRLPVAWRNGCSQISPPGVCLSDLLPRQEILPMLVIKSQVLIV